MAGGTWLEERNREKAREAAEARRLAAALDAQDEADFIARYGPAFIAGGHCLIEPDQSERDRVDVILRRDQADRAAEIDRKIAEVEVSDGVYFNLSGVVVRPTPEWLAKHEVARFVPKQPDDTVRVIETVRAVRTPIIGRLWRSGKISDEIARACLRYRMVHEFAGLEGRWSSSQWRGPDAIPSGNSGLSAGHMAMTITEAEAREEFRSAREEIQPAYREFFEKIVIHDLPLRRAARFARCRNDRVLAKFRSIGESLADFYHRQKADLPTLRDLGRG